MRLEKQQETKQFIENFMKEREVWQAEEREQQANENRRIEEYARLQRERESNLEQKKKTMEASKNAIYDKLASEMRSKEQAKIELEELRIDLAQEEQEALARKRDKDQLEQRIRKRLELIEAYQQQIHRKKMIREKEQEEEAVFRDRLMQKFAEDDRLEQLNQQKRRMKQIEHKRAVDSMVAERRRLIKEQLEEERLEAQKEIEIEKYKQAVIEQERQRLLREHAAKLVGFLPKVRWFGF